MNNTRIGVLAGLVSVVGLIVNSVPSVLLENWFGGGFDGAVPMVGTTGQTVVVYSLVLNSAGQFLTLLLALGLGYYASRRLDMGHEYRRFGWAVAVGSLVTITSLWAVGYGVQATPMDTSSVWVTLGVLVRMGVTVSFPVTVGAFAGAALSHFQMNQQTPVQPTNASTGDRATEVHEPTTDDADPTQ